MKLTWYVIELYISFSIILSVSKPEFERENLNKVLLLGLLFFLTEISLLSSSYFSKNVK